MDKNFKVHYQFKTGTPLIGSGKVNRRYYIVSKKIAFRIDNSDLFNDKKYNRKSFKKKVKLKNKQVEKIIFHSPYVRKILIHWNSKGYPFTSHKVKQSKILDRGLNRAHRALRKYSLQQVINAIDNCYEMFTSKWVKFNTNIFGVNNLALGDFFKFDKYLLVKRGAMLRDEGITGWCNECVKGMDYLQDKYSYFLKDANPYFTEQFRKTWLLYSGETELRAREENHIVTIGKQAAEYAELNKHLDISEQVILKTLDNVLNKFLSYQPKYLGWITSNVFWDDVLPKELLRYGTVISKDRRRMKKLKTQQDKK